MLFGSTVSDLYLQPHVGSDAALFKALTGKPNSARREIALSDAADMLEEFILENETDDQLQAHTQNVGPQANRHMHPAPGEWQDRHHADHQAQAG